MFRDSKKNWNNKGSQSPGEATTSAEITPSSTTKFTCIDLQADQTPFARHADTVYGYSSQVLDQLQGETLAAKHTSSRFIKSSISSHSPYDLQNVVLELQRSSVLNQLASSKWLRYDQFVANTTIEEILRRQRDDWERSQKPVVLAEVEAADKYDLHDLLKPHLKRGNRRFVKKFLGQIPNEHKYFWEHLLFELLSFQLYASDHDMSRLCVCGRHFVRMNASSSIHLCTWKLPKERCAVCAPALRYLQTWQLDVISSKNEDLLSSFELLVARTGPGTFVESKRCGSIRRHKQSITTGASSNSPWRKRRPLQNRPE